MDQRIKTILGIVILGLFLLGAYWAYGYFRDNYQQDDQANIPNTENAENIENDEPAETLAPNFAVYTHDGKEVQLEDFLGQPVVLNFWASWCPPCREEMPYFQSAYEEWGADIAFMMVNVTDGDQETQEKAEALIEEAGYTFPVYFDTTLAATMAYEAYSIPRTFFIDAQGNLFGYKLGYLDQPTLETNLSALLAL